MNLSRRGLLGGLLAAPAIIRSGLLMPVKRPPLYIPTFGAWYPGDPVVSWADRPLDPYASFWVAPFGPSTTWLKLGSVEKLLSPGHE